MIYFRFICAVYRVRHFRLGLKNLLAYSYFRPGITERNKESSPEGGEGARLKTDLAELRYKYATLAKVNEKQRERIRYMQRARSQGHEPDPTLGGSTDRANRRWTECTTEQEVQRELDWQRNKARRQPIKKSTRLAT